jgi:hypothetical protein
MSSLYGRRNLKRNETASKKETRVKEDDIFVYAIEIFDEQKLADQ